MKKEERMDPINHMGTENAVRALYYETHIIPTEENFYQQIRHTDVLYLILYWLNVEYLYPRFIEEEMDLDAVRSMEENDFEYFNLQHLALFRTFVQWLQ